MLLLDSLFLMFLNSLNINHNKINSYNDLYDMYFKFLDNKIKSNKLLKVRLIDINDILIRNYSNLIDYTKMNIDKNDIQVSISIDKDLYLINKYKLKNYIIASFKNDYYDKNNTIIVINKRNLNFILKNLNYCYLDLKNKARLKNFNNKVNRLAINNRLNEKMIKRLDKEYQQILKSNSNNILKNYLLNNKEFYFNDLKEKRQIVFNSLKNKETVFYKELFDINKKNKNSKFYYKSVSYDLDLYYKELSKLNDIYNSEEKIKVLNRLLIAINKEKTDIERILNNIDININIVFNKDIYLKNCLSYFSSDLNRLEDLKNIFAYQRIKELNDSSSINEYYCYSPDLIGEEKMKHHNSIYKVDRVKFDKVSYFIDEETKEKTFSYDYL